MTNLKKVLSLALVFALALGLMITGSAATWSDEDDITNVEDALLLNSLQIMQGNADGTFDADGIVTRAQIAKMIYVARTGGVDDKAVLFKGASNLFTDISGHWAEGYINYAAAKGFVSGRGNGIFDPDAKITGYELLKITLTALGYDSAKEGFTGAGWKLAVAALAKDTGLIDGYSADPALPITRNDAAGIIANLVYTETVAYPDGVLTLSGKTFAVSYLGLVAKTGVVTANEFTGGTAGYSTISGTSYKVSTGFEELGQTVTVYFKDSNKDGNYQVTEKIYGDAAISVLNTVIESYGNLPAGVYNDYYSMQFWLYSNGFTADTTPSLASAANILINASGVTTPANGTITTNARGEYLRVIDNDGDKIANYVVKVVKTATTVTAKSATANTISLGSTAITTASSYISNFADLSLYDVVLYYKAGTQYYVEKATSVTGAMTNVDGAKANVGGVWYYASSLALADIDGTASAATTWAGWTGTDGNYNTTKSFYLDNGNNVIYIASVADTTAYNYAYVSAANAATGSTFVPLSAKVKVVYTDGSVAVVNASKYNGTAVAYIDNPATAGTDELATSFTALVGKVIKYTLNDDGTMNVVTVATADEAAISGTITKGVATVGTVFANNATTFVVYNSSTYSYDVYTGIGNVPTLTSVTGQAVTSYGIAKVVFLTAATGATTTPKYVYITNASPIKNVDALGKITYTYSAIIDGANTTMTVNGTLAGTSTAANTTTPVGLYTYTVSAAGDYAFTGAGLAGVVSALSDGIVVCGSTAYTVDASTVVYSINAITKAVTKTTVADLAIGDTITTVIRQYTTTTADAIYVVK